MARAKNTSRAAARRRTREAVRAEQREADVDDVQEEQPETQPERRPLFRMPNVGEDLRALPSIFLTRRLLWIPLLLLLIGFALTLVLNGLIPEVAGIAVLYIQFFFLPPALFTFFIAGFVAPRASYLVGLIYGVIGGVLWLVAFGPALPSAEGEPTATPADPLVGSLFVVVTGAVYGTLAAAFAAWYRDFLRGMQERGKARRVAQEAKERAKRREERHEARRIAKRPSS